MFQNAMEMEGQNISNVLNKKRFINSPEISATIMDQSQRMAETVAITDKYLADIRSPSIGLSTLSRFKDLSLSGLQSANQSSLQSSDNPKDSGNESEGEIELTGYHRIRTVGQGSFGIAVLYERLGDGQLIVMKQINLSDLTKSERDLAMNEVEVFSKLHHPNIIAYLGSFVRGNYLFIEMEYADGGTLAQILIDKSHGERLPERFILNIFEQITSAINYMHSQNILHRDLKTANVFMNKRGIVKIGDFGISKIMSTRVQAQTVLGTPYYFSPEMVTS